MTARKTPEQKLLDQVARASQRSEEAKAAFEETVRAAAAAGLSQRAIAVAASNERRHWTMGGIAWICGYRPPNRGGPGKKSAKPVENFA